MASKATKLAAVNTIISNIGQSPVTRLDQTHPLVGMAELILDEVTRAVQSEGWEFNTEHNYLMKINVDGQIHVTDSMLGAEIGPGGMQTVIKEGKVYDRLNHTFIFPSDLRMTVTWLVDFEDLPEVFKNYVTIRAANLFAGRSVASDEAVKFGEREETIARSNCLEYETQHGNYSMFNDINKINRYQPTRPYDIITRY